MTYVLGIIKNYRETSDFLFRGRQQNVSASHAVTLGILVISVRPQNKKKIACQTDRLLVILLSSKILTDTNNSFYEQGQIRMGRDQSGRLRAAEPEVACRALPFLRFFVVPQEITCARERNWATPCRARISENNRYA